MPRSSGLAVLLAMAGTTPVFAQAGEAWQAPTLTITRYDEDWSTLADPANRSGRWSEDLKFIPLGPDAYLTTGVELRLRSENYRNNLWGGAPAPDDGYLWARALPYADIHAGAFRAFVQPILAYAIGVAPSASPVDQTRSDLLQGFAQVDLGPITLRGGRQMLSLGTERLVGTRYGPNVPLAFDGVRGDVTIGRTKLSLLGFRPVQARPGSFDDRASKTRALWGVYATRPGIDAYYLGYRNRNATFGSANGVAVDGREVRHSIGLRSHGTTGAWGWNIEGVYQFGHFAGRDISAWTLGTEFSRSFASVPMNPRATLRFNIVSGDRNAGDATLVTFNALFPKGKYFGELSPVGPINIVNLNPAISFSPLRNVSLLIAGMAYWRYTRGDGVYDIPGNLIRAPDTATARFIGKEIEASLSWQATPELELSTSLSAFDAGAFLRQTGSAKTIGMIGLEANFRI